MADQKKNKRDIEKALKAFLYSNRDGKDIEQITDTYMKSKNNAEYELEIKVIEGRIENLKNDIKELNAQLSEIQQKRIREMIKIEVSPNFKMTNPKL